MLNSDNKRFVNDFPTHAETQIFPRKNKVQATVSILLPFLVA